MPHIIRVTSVDGKKSFTRPMPQDGRIAVAKDAKVAIVDKATGEVIPARIEKVANEQGEMELVLKVDVDGEEVALIVSDSGAWPTGVETAETMTGEASEEAATDSGEEGTGEVARETAISEATSGAMGGTGLLVGLLALGAIGVGIAAASDSNDNDDDDDVIPDPDDTTAPDAPEALDLAAEDDSGASDEDDLTSETEVTITGTAEAGSTVELFNGETSLGTATADDEGNFSVDVTLPEGEASITATATDAAGNVGAASAVLTVTVDSTAPDAPGALDLDASDDDGASDSDNVTDRTDGLTISGTAEAGSTVELFDGETSLGTVVADAEGNFSLDVDLAAGERSITARATDAAGNVSELSDALYLDIGRGPQLVNASIDGEGNVVTLYFDEAIAAGSAPAAGQFTLTDGEETVAVNEVLVTGNRIQLQLAGPVSAGATLSYAATAGTVADAAGNAAGAIENMAIDNDLDVAASGAIGFGRMANIQLAGAEIVAFDPESDRLFVTSGDGLQVLDFANGNPTLIGIVEVGTNNVTSVAVKNGIVAVAVVAETKTDPGSVYFLDADAEVGQGMILNSVEVGALPDMVTFTPDGSKVLVANEGERTSLEDIEDGAELVDPEGSVSIIDLSGGVAAATVQTADFTAFNDQLDALRAEGVRLFAGTEGFEELTVAQDLEPEYISVSPDGTTALVTLQEANAIAVVDIATATITAIRPLGLKPFDGLPFDLTDEDEAINLTTDQPDVFGQFMPDSISAFIGADGKTYYVIANEGDDREDFIDPSPNGRADDLDLDPTVFPDAEALQEDLALGRLGVTVKSGINGDTDGDGDSDQILAYGGRSFSILDENGIMVFDSGAHIEQFTALGGLFDEDTNTGLFDDGRSDNKGAEPEGITTGVFGDSVLAFVALERGGGGVMVYDVTDPTNVEFVQYIRNIKDVSPEGLIYISAADSPTGTPQLVVANEVSNTVTAYEITEPGVYTMQLLHFADGEAKSLAIETAPNMAALIEAFEGDYANSITLSGGDNYIPGLFRTAQNTDAVADLLGFNGWPRVDIAMHNAMGVQASTVGNHEFDLGTGAFASAITASGEFDGALFPYLSANLDFSGDASLAPLFTETLGAGLEDAAGLSGRIVPSAIIEENGEKIGLVGATTQVLAQLTSLGGVGVKGTNANDMELLAAQLQPYIDDLASQGVNKIIVMSHLQQIELEQALAPLLEGVDIILAAGSNTRLSDEDDVLEGFTGHPLVSEGDYPIVTQGADGKTTLIVNTDNEYTYLGRLVVDFDANGEIILDSLDPAINGAYASTAENVAEAWGTTVENLDESAFAEGTRGAEVRELVDAVNTVLADQGSNVFGFSDVFLEGTRALVRSEETNLGNLTADANAAAAREALGLGDDAVVVSYKNGGGVRDSIGSLSGTGSDVVLGPNEGGVVTELDVGAALAFNNGLLVFDTTPQGLLNILNSPNVFQAGNGGFGQIGGMQVSYDPDAPAGSRVVDIALVDGNGNKTAIVDDGAVVAGAPASFTMVTLDFIAANDGDGTEIAENGTNFRYLQVDGAGNYSVSAALGTVDQGGGDLVVDLSTFTGTKLGEQQALADYLADEFGTLAAAFDLADTPQSEDLRIQNIDARTDTVLDGTGLTPMAVGIEPLMVEAFA